MRAFYYRSHARRKVAGEVHVTQTELHGANVEHLWVHPEARHKGLARSLFTELCADADAEWVTLWLEPAPFSFFDPKVDIEYPSGTTPKELRAFYHSFGFRMKPAPFENVMARSPRRSK